MKSINTNFKILGTDVTDIVKIATLFNTSERAIIAVETLEQALTYKVRVLTYDKYLADYEVTTIGKYAEIFKETIVQELGKKVAGI